MLQVQQGKIVVKVVDKFVEIFKMNSKNPSNKRQMILQRHAFFTELALKGGFLAYAMAAVFYFVEPIHSFLFQNKLVTILPVYFPYLDTNTTNGFAVTTFFHLFMITLSGLGCAYSDFLLFMIIVNIPMLSHFMTDDIKELNEILKSKRVNMMQVKGKFRNILFMHREILE